MIQQQRFGGSMLGTPAKFVSEYGVSALSRGVTMTMGREAMFTMSMLGITPLIQQSLVENSGAEKNIALAGGSLASARGQYASISRPMHSHGFMYPNCVM